MPCKEGAMSQSSAQIEQGMGEKQVEATHMKKV